jgi:hypothetical protein
MVSGFVFEDEVRRVARELWPAARFDGSALVDGRERDGIFETEWVTHLIEATTSRTKLKAETDIKKLVALRKKLLSGPKPVQAWFVTAEEPTADQRSVAPKDGSVRVLAFEQFRSQLIDAFAYLRDRELYPFGSAHDPDTGSAVTDADYLALPLEQSDPEKSFQVGEVADLVAAGRRVCILGDYGVGKSMTMREVFRELVNRYRADTSSCFPLLLNLRDHYGQDDPAEALERHGRRLGFARPEELVRAWRAGWACLLLDGFDEMAAPGWSGPVVRVPEIRRRSVQLVRSFVLESASTAGLAIAGRAYYFDSNREMRAALGLSSGDLELNVGSFDRHQIEQYLTERGWHGQLPDWLPTRPLLLAYLTSRGFVDAVIEVSDDLAPAAAWNQLFHLICEREARIEADIDGQTLRHIVERIATTARKNQDRVGPLDFADIEKAFLDVSGRTADDRARVILQRLPGLGIADPTTGTRQFVDPDLADTASAGDLLRFVVQPFLGSYLDSPPGSQMGELGIEVAALGAAADEISVGQLVASMHHAADQGAGSSVAFDIARVISELGEPIAGASALSVSSIAIEDLVLDDPSQDLSGLSLSDCIVGRLVLPRDGSPDDFLPLFSRTHIARVEGRIGERDLPARRFVDCDFAEFVAGVLTNDAILQMKLPVGSKVMLTILKKLFAQRGRGRKEGALTRGIPQDQRALVTPALAILQREGLITSTRSGNQRIWMPVRGSSSRAFAMLQSPVNSADEVLRAAADL